MCYQPVLSLTWLKYLYLENICYVLLVYGVLMVLMLYALNGLNAVCCIGVCYMMQEGVSCFSVA